MALIDPAYEERIIETVAREYLKVFPMLKGKYSAHFEKWAEIKPQKITVVGDGTDTDETRLGAVKDIRFAIEQLCIDDDMLVIVEDNVLNFSLTRFIAIPKKM